jgi:vacuolar protein sorting-associated protein 29
MFCVRVAVLGGGGAEFTGDPESLAGVQRALDVDILISGHTHKHEVYQYHNKYFINPGSTTGAFSPFTSDVIPSFVLMAIKGAKVVTYVYELKDGELNVSKSEFVKQK